MHRKRKNNVNSKGREKYSPEQFIGLSYKMIRHPNFCALNGASLKVLLALCQKHTGFNNGKIGMSYDELAVTLHMGKTTAHRACQELEYYGFIKMRKKGRFYGRKATEWEITFLKSEGYHPSHDWKEIKTRRNARPKRRKATPLIEQIIEESEDA